ncbi:glycosyltransferase family 61 protein [Falsiroseomonas sp. E2-1-a20]|uniref:glycosyltransferase family 61 protein n=1 Tax=Falsiroseomonas sp. E2-1-a20 TaxID=3239300 RepID=UPI003F4169F0
MDATYGGAMMPQALPVQRPASGRSVVAAEEMAHSTIQVSPAAVYPRRPPHFANLDLVEPGDRSALEGRWRETNQTCPPILLHHLGSATIGHPGAVWLSETQVVAESLHNLQPRDRAALVAAGPPALVSAAQGQIACAPAPQDAALLLARAGSMNFGHWLVEHLGALLLLRDAMPELRPKLLVNDPRGPDMLRVFTDSARLAELDPAALLLMARAKGIRVAELLMLSPASQHSHMKHPAALAALARLAPARRAKDLLFVRRTSTAKRVLHNLDLVEAAAIRLGFRSIVPGRMTLAEQIEAFAGARVVAGVSGADLTNIVFMPEGGEVVCLLPSRGREFFFWDICCIRGHRYWSIFGPPTTERGGGHDDFTVDTELAVRVMAQAVGAP